MVGADTLKSVFAVGFGLMFVTMMAIFFNISLTVKAGFSESMDPAYPYLQAVAMHSVGGEPFIKHLSDAVEQGSANVNGVDIAGELKRFGEAFELKDGSGETIVKVENPLLEQGGNVKAAYLAVPPGGYLVMTYEWP
jgi:hypothetical protein